MRTCLFVFLTWVGGANVLFAMDLVETPKMALLKSERIFNNLTTYSLSLTLGDANLLNRGTHFFGAFVGPAFHEEIAGHLNELVTAEDSERRKIMLVDFDGVLGMHVLVRTADAYRFTHILNWPNFVLLPQLHAGATLLASSDYDEKRNKVMERIYEARKMPRPERLPHEDAKEIDWIIGQVNQHMFAASPNFDGFTAHYEVVDDKLLNLLKTQADRGAELFVLSGRASSDQKELFLTEAYGDLFNYSEAKAALGAQMSNSFSPNRSWVHATAKGTAISKAIFAASQPISVGFLDDHVTSMSSYEYQTHYTITSRNNARAVYITYPVMSTKFDHVRYVDEMCEFLTSCSAELIAAIFRDK